jgi:hypothetical protein
MTKPNRINNVSQKDKMILLYTGNIMMDGGRGGFLNTSMLKNNAEVWSSPEPANISKLVNSLRHIKPQDDEDSQWKWTDGSVIRLQHLELEDELLIGETGRGEFEITGLIAIL